MLIYVVKRLAAMIPTLIGITLVTFMIVRFAPGDPVAASMGKDTGPATDASGGGGQQTSKADAIKAKKKLLGFLREDYAVQVWDAEAAAAAEPVLDDKYRNYEYLSHEGSLAELSKWPYSLALSADGGSLFVGTEDGRVLEQDPDSGELVRNLGEMTSRVQCVAVSDDGASVVAGDGEGRIRLWSGDGSVRGELQLEYPVGAVAFLPGGSRFLSACDDSVVRLHGVPKCEVVREYRGHTSVVRALAVAPDGKRFWTGGYDRKLREWNVDATQSVRVVAEHGQAITDIALTRDGASCFTACEDRMVREIDLAADAETPVVHVFEGHLQGVTAVAVTSDGQTVFSGGKDGTIRAWNRAERRLAAGTEKHAGKVRDLLVSADDSVLWSASDSWAEVAMWRQYLNWAGKIAVLDFDRSFHDDEPVLDKIKKALPITLSLNVIAITIIYVVSIPVGVMAAVKRGGLYDNASSILLFMLWSIPSFWLATMLIIWFSSTRNFNWLPSVGLHDPAAARMTYLPWLKDWFVHTVLPIISLTYAGFASLSRFARTSMLETIGQDFVRTARAKGLSEHIVIYKHALRNSLITIITLLGNLLPAMIGGSVIIEMIFSIDGMGLLAFNAILQRDYPVIMATTTFGAILTLLGILVSDLLYGVADPRISHA